jgi:hypothetical protein
MNVGDRERGTGKATGSEALQSDRERGGFLDALEMIRVKSDPSRIKSNFIEIGNSFFLRLQV